MQVNLENFLKYVLTHILHREPLKMTLYNEISMFKRPLSRPLQSYTQSEKIAPPELLLFDIFCTFYGKISIS